LDPKKVHQRGDKRYNEFHKFKYYTDEQKVTTQKW